MQVVCYQYGDGRVKYRSCQNIMPFTCPVCGNEEYQEEDGGFFCTECGTQSQDYIVQEATYVYDPGMTRHEVVRERVTESNIKPKASLGRPWTIYEAYQIIILAQTDSLISLGASEDLKDVVYTLWANYLSKLQVAFCSKERVVPEVVERYKTGRPREIFRGTLEKPSNLKPISLKETLKRQSPRIKRKRKLSKSSTEGETDKEEETEEPMDPSKSVFVDFIKSSDRNSYTQAHNSAKTSPQWMNINKTITLCYIGLMLTNPDILPCDVMRWLYNGQVPFLSTSHLLPIDMVLSNMDAFLFSVERFTVDTFIYEVNKLCTYLKLTKMPELDLNTVVFRFIRDLCLPNELYMFVQRLMKKIPYNSTSRKAHYRAYEEPALGYILLALKIIFGLDDISERRLSEYTAEVQTLTQLEPKLFNWTEWKKFWMYKQDHEFDAYQQLTSELSSSKLEHLDQLLECYEKSNKGKRRFTTGDNLASTGRQDLMNIDTENKIEKELRVFDPEYRDSLAKPLAAAIAENSIMGKDQSLKDKSLNSMDGSNFRGRTFCHLVDFASFRGKCEILEADVWHKCEELLAKTSPLQPKFVHYQYPEGRTKLPVDRHQSYLWLLNLACQVGGCQMIALDKMVIRLSQIFVLLSEGKATEGLICTKFGLRQKK